MGVLRDRPKSGIKSRQRNTAVSGTLVTDFYSAYTKIAGHQPALIYRRRVRRIKERLGHFACAPYSNKHWQRLSKRLLKFQTSIFIFLDTPGVRSHNNTDERAIRPQGIIRNRSFQNRTIRGADAHSTMTSVVETLWRQKRNPLEELQTIYPLQRQRAMDRSQGERI